MRTFFSKTKHYICFGVCKPKCASVCASYFRHTSLSDWFAVSRWVDDGSTSPRIYTRSYWRVGPITFSFTTYRDTPYE